MPEEKPMPLTSEDNPVAEKPAKAAKAVPAVEAPVLIGTGNSSNPDVQHLASRRAHLVGALATGPANSAIADEIEAIDATLAELGYRA
jgi:hypothetical protein